MVEHKLEKLGKACESAAVLFQKVDTEGVPPPEFIKAIAESLRSWWGTYWRVDRDADNLQSVTIWRTTGLDSKGLDEKTKAKKLGPEEGAPYQVWKTGKPVWTSDLVKAMCSPRSIAATEAGLNCGVWFAVKNKDVVYGVVELLGRGVLAGTEETLFLIEHMGIELGRIAHLTFKR